MSNEELLKMYEAIKADPGELVRAAARKRLINFARYIGTVSCCILYPVGYVCAWQNTKDDCTTAAATWQIGGVKPQITRIYVGVRPRPQNMYRFVCGDNRTGF